MHIQEFEIVKHLLPDVKTHVVHVGIVQKQTDAGEMTRFSALFLPVTRQDGLG